ncbi:MAG: B12-binding domain-containing radical SAM protein [Gammaproteobacteria bacterium]|nr:B12-binding domain-containing radical SAM protein [Gammaproteobacteria bacterium]MDH5239635.1 B12-binding domain-containing radical SAM protein [Gammaproteobacteria bacterium]MDH5261875.1 B12-binding domain-containing radical SAM protein [Gammaproteobacteria bacterium]
MLKETEKHDVALELQVPRRRPAYDSELSDIQSAILATITYRDLFDYPTTATEIYRYLHGVRCTSSDVDDVLADAKFINDYLLTDGQYFALKGRDTLFEVRRRRRDASAPLWRRAHRIGKILASLPFVRMVAVTGSLAVNNPGSDADIDIMLVTDGGRLWSVRLLAKILQFADTRLVTAHVCVNHLVSMRALELAQPGLFVAQEVAQMVPVFGLNTYAELRSRNKWVDDYLPNADGEPPGSCEVSPVAPRLRRFLEALLSSPLGSLLENWESGRKIRKYNESSFLLGAATPFTREATGHRRTTIKTIEAAFSDRLAGPRQQAGRLRILFGQAYHLRRDRKLFKAMQPFPPLGTLYAAAVARSLGHQVRVHDSMLASSLDEWSAALQVNDPDVAILYEDNFNYLTKMCLLEMRDAAIEMIRRAKDRGAVVLVCGSDSADEPHLYLDAGADYILIGEGEATLGELLGLLAGTTMKPAEEIAGLAFRDNSGEVRETGRRPVIRRLDDMPIPAWDLIDLDRYSHIWNVRHGRTAVNMVTTRGCPYHCNWCAKPIWGQSYSVRSPGHVVAEIEKLKQLAAADYIWFMDDMFGLKPSWIEKFASLLESHRLQIKFKCLSRADILLREGEIDALARAGCDVVWLGAESGSQKVLDAMEKGFQVDMIDRACALLKEKGVRVGLFIQFGYPGETRQDIRKTLEMIRRVMPEELGISVSYPLPGTPFYDRVRSQLGDSAHWRDSDDLAMLFRGPYNTGFYRALHRYAHSDLAFRKAMRRKFSFRSMLALAYHGVRWSAASASMAVYSRLPHERLGKIRPELDSSAASRPSEQSAE